MRALLDTNVLARMAQPGHPQYDVALKASDRLLLRGDDLRVVPQSLYEFYVVATRPVAQNGLGMAPPRAAAEVRRLLVAYPLLDDEPGIYAEWERLVRTHGVSGKPAHDARLIAAMRVHGVPAILTFNVADFSRYPGIQVLDPAAVIARP